MKITDIDGAQIEIEDALYFESLFLASIPKDEFERIIEESLKAGILTKDIFYGKN